MMSPCHHLDKNRIRYAGLLIDLIISRIFKPVVGGNVSGSANDSIQFSWLFSPEDNAFANDMPGNAKLYLVSNSDTSEAGSGAYANQ
jgi:hypothetical protein